MGEVPGLGGRAWGAEQGVLSEAQCSSVSIAPVTPHRGLQEAGQCRAGDDDGDQEDGSDPALAGYPAPAGWVLWGPSRLSGSNTPSQQKTLRCTRCASREDGR